MSTAVEAVKAVFGWLKKRQETAIVYHLLKNEGRVQPVVETLAAPQAELTVYRDGLVDAGYLKEVGTMGSGLAWFRSLRGDELLEALEADRGEE
ncbi:hypothetical protein [Candidatus Palauibacter sp.]|uniref:hypothetical protein n=1 Tax=Candidatus Palauibacter sp. TaxID=3101350 RepID=UPI003B01F2FA